MKSHARVVVLGGGIHGVSTLYHLAAEGWSDVVLIEKGELTSGTTWHAAGQCPHFNGSLNFARICDHGIQLYRSLEKETGQATGWHGCGGIRLARDADELDWHKHVVGIARQVGFEAHIVGLEEIRKLHPFVELHNVVGGTYTPHDGHVDPTSATNAIAKAARKRGAEIYKHTLVTEITFDGDEWTVVTDKGRVTCDHLVIAAGFFTTKVAGWLGIRVPLINVVHQYLVTEPVAELKGRTSELPVIRDPGSSSYMRQEQQGLLGGPYETEGIKTVSNDVPWTFDMDLLEPDLDHISPWLEQMIARFPLFGTIGVRRTIAGFIAHTPDLVPLVGPAPGFPNLWLNCGSTTGIAQGPGCSKYLSQWIVHGAAEINMSSLDPRRFGNVHTDDWVSARTIEASSHMYEIHPPGFYFTAGRPLRTSGIYECLLRKGAVFGEAMGWERAKWFSRDGGEKLSYRRNSSFSQVAGECRAVRERVGVLDLTSFSKLEVHGRDATAFLDRVLANRIPAKTGGMALCHLLTVGGAVDGELTVTRVGEERYYLLGAGAMEYRDFDQLMSRRRSGEDVVVEDVTPNYGVLLVTGPRSRDTLKQISKQSLENGEFPWLTAQQIEVAGVGVRALRVSYAGELGWELHVPEEQLLKVYDAVMHAGTQFGIADFGFYALNSLRMEKAYRGFGSELTNEVSLIEAGMKRFAVLGKGDFTGRDALMHREVKTKLVYLSVDAPELDIIGEEPMLAGDRVVGTVTSGAFSHLMGCNLAFAYVEPSLAMPGTALEVLMLGERHRAEVLADAVYDPSNTRLRS